MIKTLPIFGMSPTVYLPVWQLMIVAVKRLPRFYMFLVRSWRQIQKCICSVSIFSSDLSSGIGYILTDVAQFVSDAVGVHGICIVDLGFLDSDTFELESRAIVELLRSA